jgi:hypothetical protein
LEGVFLPSGHCGLLFKLKGQKLKMSVFES